MFRHRYRHTYRLLQYRSSARMLFGFLLAWIAFACSTLPVIAAPVTQEVASSPSVWPILLPLLAATVAIERTIEIIWNYADWLLLNMRKWQPADVRSLQYSQFKSGTSLVLGIIFGILVSNYTGMRLFDYLLPLAPRFLSSVPNIWDVLITGAILGAGAKPVHDLLGIVTQLKNLLGYTAIRQREAAGSAMAEGVLRLAQSDAQGMIDVPGVGPTRLSGPGQMSADDEDVEMPEGSPTDQYIETLRSRTVF